LRMCERYDRVNGFTHIVDLSHEASQRLRSTKSARGLEISANGSRNIGHYQFLNRRAIQSQQDLRVFQSPNFALRLQRD
jgi:hypothetical protein